MFRLGIEVSFSWRLACVRIVIHRSDSLSSFQACLDDFTHHNIDVACNLLETCGRFLYRSPETSVRMANMLEILMRLKNVKNLDPRHSTLVENAYYLCKPPERSARVSKVRPPLHQVQVAFSFHEFLSVLYVTLTNQPSMWCIRSISENCFSQISINLPLSMCSDNYVNYHGPNVKPTFWNVLWRFIGANMARFTWLPPLLLVWAAIMMTLQFLWLMRFVPFII